jgi:hypothetical protein
MNRLGSFLALSAIVVAGAFAGTAAQASANVNVSFKIHNADASASMIRSGAPDTGITGLMSPAASILPGGDDPATGSALFSLGTPASGGEVHASVSYANASNGVDNLCTFTIKVSRSGLASYTLHFTADQHNTNCSVPSDVTNATGQFTSTTYALNWSR